MTNKLTTANDVMEVLRGLLDDCNCEIYKGVSDARRTDEEMLKLVHGSRMLSAIIEELETRIK